MPVLPGTENPVTDRDEALQVAKSIGFPLIIKAAFGGGGRGPVRERRGIGARIQQRHDDPAVGDVEVDVARGQPLARVFDAWGMDRCLWGTDWTRAFEVVDYEQATRPFMVTDRLTPEERAMLMGGACAKAYGWSPKKG